jgi:hypothetical protein
LDDDVEIAERANDFRPQGPISRAAVVRSLNEMAKCPELRLVGWRAESFPDNSVVCHARRLVGLPQDSFVGAGAMLVRFDRDLPFFPKIYNEDWLFMYGILRHNGKARWQVGLAGVVPQRPYDAFLPQRARAEEWGDILAEGLFQVVGKGQKAEAQIARREYWQAVSEGRLRMIHEIMAILGAQKPLHGPYVDVAKTAKALTSTRRSAHVVREAARIALTAAEERLTETVDGQSCVSDLMSEFLANWRVDLKRWRKRLTCVRIPTISALLKDPSCALMNGVALGALQTLELREAQEAATELRESHVALNPGTEARLASGSGSTQGAAVTALMG